MLAKFVSCAIVSLDADIVEVEVDIIRGFPAFQLVGLPDAAVRESRDRVHSAVKNSGLTSPTDKRITISLAPADLRKEGPAYDLPIAVGILAASQQVWPDKLEGAMFVGELSLYGATRHTKVILSCSSLALAHGLAAALAIGDKRRRATALAAMAPHLTGTDRDRALEHGLAAALAMGGE